jgi:histidine ammonia-lyase
MPKKNQAHLHETLITISGSTLNLHDLNQVACHDAGVALSPQARTTVKQNASVIDQLSISDQPIYGVNTGFGIFADRRIEPEHASEISRNLILSHAVGVGPPFPKEITRAAMLIRANTLSRGHSGVRPQIIEGLIKMLNRGVTPLIPSQGSLGSSGDLAPLAHLVLVLADVTDDNNPDQSGIAHFEGQTLPGAEAMQSAGIERVILGPKEGLALTNGATFSAAITALALIDARRLLYTAEIATAMTFEALLGNPQALDPRIHIARSHPGQIQSAQRMLAYLTGSSLVGSSSNVQDAYSLRCSPQIIGPAWEALDFSADVITREVNATTDNPMIFDRDVLSGGNFHGQPIGMVADFMKIALSEVSNLSERRTYRMLTAHTNAGLPPMLISDPSKVGLFSGLMMLQYTAASLCLENHALVTPASTKSLPTSAGQEDHNANSATAARHLTDIVTNMYAIIAIELICAAQALELRLAEVVNRSCGNAIKNVFECIRSVSPFVAFERPMSKDIKAVASLIQSGAILNAAGIEDAML